MKSSESSATSVQTASSHNVPMTSFTPSMAPTRTSESPVSHSVVTTTRLTTFSSSTSTFTPISNATVTMTAPSTPHQCTEKDCPGCVGTCIFNMTLGECFCNCEEFAFGDECVFGESDTSAEIDSENRPTRNATFTLGILMDFDVAFEDINSPQSLKFIKTLMQELEALCKEADPQNFKTVQVIKLSPGSVIAESVVEYLYPNNETQIEFVNNQLDGALAEILNDTSNLNKISQVFNASVELKELSFEPPEIKNITDLKDFVNCTKFAQYTAEVINGQWQCVGPCKTNPDYCHQHGTCLNNIKEGPVCRCLETSLKQYYGPQCDLFRYGPGFYGALFGSLAVLLLVIMIVIAVIAKKRHMGFWKTRDLSNRRLSAFDEDFFDFSETGDPNLGVTGSYTSQGSRHL
ncbi:mucin-4 [Acanthopagrus schlegelii]